MQPESRPTPFQRPVPPLAVSLAALLGLVAPLPAQEAAKLPRPLPHLLDVKTPAPASALQGVAPERGLEPGAPLQKPAKTTAAGRGAAAPIDFSLVRFDEPGDGRIWARGRTYKASFDLEGATYIPFLGSNAPRNFPVAARLESARIGGVDLAAEAQVVERAGNAVTIERGTLREVWHLAPDRAEQTFELPARPSTAGALELRIALASELVAAEEAGGIVLSNEHGNVSISSVVVVDASGARTAVESHLADGALAIEVPAPLLAAARYPLVIDPVYTTNALDTTATATALPDIANGSTGGNFAAVYQYSFSATDSDVWTLDVYYGVPVAGSGVWADYTSSSWLFPRIAYNALHNTYLTVCSVRPTSSSPGEIWCRARTGGGATQFNQVQIQSSILGSCFYPDVGGDPSMVGPTYFMVVWTRNFSANDWDVHGRLIGFDGTPQGTSNVFLANSSAMEWYPRISKTDGRPPFATQEWNVVWMREGSASDVWGAQIHWDGIVTTPAFPIDQTTYADIFPSASSPLDAGSGPRPWMVTYRRQYLTEGDVYAKVLVGGVVQTELNVSVWENADPYEDQIEPDVDSNGQRFVVAYGESYNNSTSDRDLYVATMHYTNNTITIDEGHQGVDLTGYDTQVPQISCGMTATNVGFAYYGLAWPHIGVGTEDTFVGACYEPASYDSFCAGDGTQGTCPCGNNGGAGRGCSNSATIGGGLYASGVNYVSQDALVLTAFDLPSGTLGLFFQGTAASAAAPFGDGLLCVGGTIVRLGVKAAPAGFATYPASGDLPISAQGGVPAEGGFRTYQMWYRDAMNYCTAATFNITSGVRVLWLR